MRRDRRRRARGFTLLEVVVSLAILAVSLTMLLVTNASNIENASRARDLTIASLLARSKMIDVEQQLLDKGFDAGSSEEEGTFEQESHPEVQWHTKIDEVELNLDNLGGLCSGFTGEEAESGATPQPGGCEDMLGSFGGPLQAMVTDIGNSVRLVQVTVTWPVGTKYHESMSVTDLVTRQDWATSDQNEAIRQAGGNANTNTQEHRLPPPGTP